jgi:ubiquinone/menaquinone biosynthesis C-methylase UbiE
LSAGPFNPQIVLAEFARVLRSGGRLSLIDTDRSTFRLDIGDPQITKVVRDGVRVERNHPSNATTRRTSGDDSPSSQTLPEASPAPERCFSTRVARAFKENFFEEISSFVRCLGAGLAGWFWVPVAVPV